MTMIKKQKRIFVPARAEVPLIDAVNVQRKRDNITWPALISGLFHAYLKKGTDLWTRKV